MVSKSEYHLPDFLNIETVYFVILYPLFIFEFYKNKDDLRKQIEKALSGLRPLRLIIKKKLKLVPFLVVYWSAIFFIANDIMSIFIVNFVNFKDVNESITSFEFQFFKI